MRRRIAFVFMLFLIIITLPGQKGYGITSLADTLNYEELEFKEAVVSGWVKSNVHCHDKDGLESLAMRVSEYMGVDFTPEWIETEGGKKVAVNALYEEGHIGISVENLYNNILEGYDTLIIVDITQYAKPENINDIRDRLEKCLSQYGSGPPVNLCITAYRRGELQERLRRDIIHDMLVSLDTTNKRSIEYENLISVTGYTRNITRFVKSNNEKLNINIACRYSSTDDRTYFFIGTPVINMEY